MLILSTLDVEVPPQRFSALCLCFVLFGSTVLLPKTVLLSATTRQGIPLFLRT